MAEELIIKLDTSADSDVGSLDKTLNNVASGAKKADTALADLRKELKSAKSDMLQYEEGTEEYSRALVKAAEAQRRLKETNDIVKAGVRDMGEISTLAAGTIGGLASGFQVAQGAMALFGVENEALLETMVKLQAVMAVTSGISGFANGIDNLQDLMAGFKAESDLAASGVENLVEKNALLASNVAQTQTLNKNSVNTNALILQQQKDLAAAEIAKSQSMVDSGKATQAQADAYKKYTEETIKANEAEVNLTDSKEKGAKATEKGAKATESATKSMTKSMLTMGLWLAAIVAVTYGVTKLIEWLNKIPKDLEVKVALNEDAIKATQKVRESIKEIQHQHDMANKARLEGDDKTSKKIIDNLKKQLEEIKDGASKEYELAKDKDKWLTEFAKAENERQRQLAYNKALFAKQAEAEINKTIAEQNKALYGELIKDEKTFFNSVNPWGRTVKEMIDEGAFTVAFGMAQEYKDAVESLDKSTKELEVLSKLKPYDIVDFDKSKPSSTKSSGSTTPGSKFTPPKLEEDINFKRPEEINRNEIKWEEWKVNEKSNLQKEEESQLNDTIGKRLNVFQQLRNEINLNAAALKDVEDEQYAAMVMASNAEQKYRDFNEALKVQEDLYNQLQQTKNREVAFDNELLLLNDKLKRATEDYSKSKNKNEAAANKAVVDAIKEEIAAKQKQIETNNALIKSNEEEIKKIEEKLNTLKEGSSEYEEAIQLMNELDLERLRILKSTADAEIAIWEEKMLMVRDYGEALASLSSGFADISQGNMDLINAEYDRQVWAENEKVQSAQAREDALHNLDVKRWEALQKDFEMQKKWKEAQAWMDFASGSVGIWSGVNSKLGVPGVILAGIQQAALLATTIGNIKSIKAQQMLKPQRGGGSSGAVGGSVPALNPHKESLTSKDENLNKMSRANLDKLPQTVVRVTDINEVQAKVNVRDSNSTM